MQAVARRAGLSTGLAYHHFGSKGGLVAAVLEDFYDRLDDHAMGRRLEGAWHERERERVRLATAFYLKDPLSRVLLGRLHRAPEVVAVEEDRFRRQVEMGETFGEIESVKAVADLNAPLAGTIVESNAAIEEHLEILSRDPWNEGWMIRIQPRSKSIDHLMDAAAYEEHLAK